MRAMIFMMFTAVSVLAGYAEGAEVVQAQLCSELGPDRKSCREGKVVEEGGGVSPGTTVHWLTGLKTAQSSEMVYHVWLYLDSVATPRAGNFKLNSYGDVSALLPMIGRIETPVEDLQPKAITAVALGIKAAPNWRTRSSKDLPPGLTGQWRVELWTADATAPLASASFEVK